MTMSRVSILVAAFVGLSCTPKATPSNPPGDPAADPTPQAGPDPVADFTVDASTIDFDRSPTLRRRLLETSHGYFRFVHNRFTKEVCARFAATDPPEVNLHGDAHLEQIAVTAAGRGLSDFDYSSTGPAAVDIVRLGASVRLAARANGWQNADAAVDAMLDAYAEALGAPAKPPPEPKAIARLRASMSSDHDGFVDAAVSLMTPAADGGKHLLEVMTKYEPLARAANKKLGRGYFKIKDSGSLHIGIGSALAEKYLIRVEGPKKTDDDDAILEAKALGSLAEVPCLKRDATGAGDHLTAAASVYHPYEMFGIVTIDKGTYWVHRWTASYKEISILDSIRSEAELVELARDAGFQLGRGHPKLPGADEAALRKQLQSYVGEHKAALAESIAALDEATHRAWEQFRSEAASN